MKKKPVSIPLETGEHVSGVLSVPDEFRASEGTGIIVAHGAGNDMNNPLIVFLSEGLAPSGSTSHTRKRDASPRIRRAS